MFSVNPQQTNNLLFILDNYNQCVIIVGSIGARTLSKLLKVMRLRRAVPEIPAKISVPSGLPLNKSLSLLTPSESTLSQPLIPLRFISFRSNVYKKKRGGVSLPQPQSFATRHYPLAGPTHIRKHPQPQSLLCFNSQLSGFPGWWQDPPSGTAKLFAIARVSRDESWLSLFGLSRVAEHGPQATAPLIPQVPLRRNPQSARITPVAQGGTGARKHISSVRCLMY
jgi:hypothetical protein